MLDASLLDLNVPFIFTMFACCLFCLVCFAFVYRKLNIIGLQIPAVQPVTIILCRSSQPAESEASREEPNITDVMNTKLACHLYTSRLWPIADNKHPRSSHACEGGKEVVRLVCINDMVFVISAVVFHSCFFGPSFIANFKLFCHTATAAIQFLL